MVWTAVIGSDLTGVAEDHCGDIPHNRAVS